MREAITDGTASRWTDVSQWYWEALLGRTQGPWWAITVAERRRPEIRLISPKNSPLRSVTLRVSSSGMWTSPSTIEKNVLV